MKMFQHGKMNALEQAAKMKALLVIVFFAPMLGKCDVRPNILFILMEDMGPHISAYGDTTAYTPRLDELASGGMVFNQVCVTAATCAASRGSLFTGLYPHQNGIMGFIESHGFFYRANVPSYVPMLKRAGYYTGITYKTGVQPWEMVAFDQNYNWRVNKLFPENNQNEIKNGTDNFKYFLETRPKDRPFYFQSQNSDTHTPWVGKKVDEHFSIKGMPGAEIYKSIDTATVKPLPHFGPDFDMNDSVKRFMSGYYEAIQRVDYFVGRILGLLEEYGVEEETLVIFSADHGPSHLSRGKTTAYEFGLRVPFIVRWPGKTVSGTQSAALVSFVDLMPTFLEVAGVERPSHLAGHSLMPVLDGRMQEGMRKYIFSAYVSHTTGYFLYWPTRSISEGRYKLILNVLGDGKIRRGSWMGTDTDPGLIQDNADQLIRDAMAKSGPLASQAYNRSLMPPEFELYDLKSDPGELQNLAGQKAFAQIENRLKGELLRWRTEIVVDPFLDPAYVKAFSQDYAAKVKFYNQHSGDEKVVEGMSNLNRWGSWRLDMSRWIPAWDAGSYRQDPSRK